jgi:P2 family phage contractile tail tube protein
MGIQINRVTNGNLYIDGANFLGTVMEMNLPAITQKTAEHNALGMIGTVETFAGFEKMESTIKWTAVYAKVLSLISDPFKSHSLQLRGNIDKFDSGGLNAQESYVVYLTAAFKKVPTGDFKQHENVELETELAVTAIKVEIAGAEILEFDALANIYKVDGVDKLATYRANIGA